MPSQEWLEEWRARERVRRRDQRRQMRRVALSIYGSNITTLPPDVDEDRATQSLLAMLDEVGAAKDVLALRYDTV